MSVREIIEVPNPLLKTISAPVAEVRDDTRALMDDMLETMYDANGIGLAAIQIGVAQRIIVMDISQSYSEDEAADETRNYQEGCLSVPGFYDDVARPAQCKVKFLDYDGQPQEIDCDGLLATCIQHEMDHLNGIVFLDHLSRLKRQMALKKLKKATQGASV